MTYTEMKNDSQVVFNTLLRLKHLLVGVYKEIDNCYVFIRENEKEISVWKKEIERLQKEDVVDLQEINSYKCYIDDSKFLNENGRHRIRMLEEKIAEVEDITLAYIEKFGDKLSRKQMETLTGGHSYNFDKADEWNIEKGKDERSFLDYVFVHGVEYVRNKQRMDGWYDCPTHEMPFHEACCNAVLRGMDRMGDKAPNPIKILMDIQAEQQRQEEQQRIEELESKYEVNGKVITLR